MKTSTTNLLRLLCVLALVSAVAISGCAARSSSNGAASSSAGGSVAVAPESLGANGSARTGVTVDSASKGTAAPTPQGVVAPDQYIISAAGMTIEVKDLDAAVEAVRKLVETNNGTISDLSLDAGQAAEPTPMPLDSTSRQVASTPTPGTAQITIRVPADKLAAIEKDAAAVGRVLAQSGSQSDVTQQHVDLSARLRNLRAEEARLRTFFDKAKKVSEMLAIEQELSRVRGEIESMQAQLDYLERQAAMATFAISLTEPGALVSAGAGGWGFSAAVRNGIRAAAAMITGLITLLLAMSPLILLAVAIWLIVMALVRRRRRRLDSRAIPTDSTDDTENAR